MSTTKVLILRSIDELVEEDVKGRTIKHLDSTYDLNYINAFELPKKFLKDLDKIEADCRSCFNLNFANKNLMLDANTMTKIEECLVGYHEGNKSEREVKNFLAHYISPSATGLNERLVMRIDESFPQILIAHTGLVFQRFPGEFIKALIIAKQNHPSLRLGIQGGIPMIETTFNKKNVNKRDYNIVFQNGFFEDSEEMNILIDYFL